jgi:putative FmdB family regulatory protein
MPIYEYRCQQCQKVFEYSHRMSDPSKTTCEECGGALERLISRTAFALKGSGWYKDLYSSSKPESGGGATDAAKPAETKTETKTETKSSEGSGTGTGTGTGSGSGAGSGGSSGTKAAAGAS